jgi:hypothetical protein
VNDLEDRVRAHLHARLAAVDVAPGSPDAVRPARPRRWLVPTAAAATVALVAAAGVGAWSARDAGDDAGDAGDAVVVADDPETPTTVGVTVDDPVPTTTAPPPTPAEPGIEIAPSGPVWSPADSQPVIAGHGDGFVAIVQSGGATTLRTSADGSTWNETAVDVGGAAVRDLTSNGDALLATGSLDDEPWAATSADDGRTWSAVELALPDLAQPEWTRRWADVSGAAPVPGGFVVVGGMSDTVDLPALALAQTGVDMTTFDGYGEGWGDTTVEIDPGGDDAPITVDLTVVDAAVRGPYGRTTALVWQVDGDGIASAPSVDPFGAGRVPRVAASGSAGVAVLTTTAGGQGPTALSSSSDGVTWTDVRLPTEATYADLSAGSTGYLLADGSGVWRSDDLLAWESVEQGLPDVGASWSVAAGGPAGFVAVAWPMVPAEEPQGPIVVESGGRRLTVDEDAGLTTVVDIATGEELLRWEGDVSAPPPGVLTADDDGVRYADPDTGEIVFEVALDEMMRAMSARAGSAHRGEPFVRWSVDGTTWQEVAVPGGTVSILAAVSDDRALVMPLSLEGSGFEDLATP